MKQLFSFLVIGLVSASLSGFKNDNKKFADKNSNVKVVFNRQLEFNDLVKIKADLIKKNIVVSFKKLQFDDNGKLMSIDFNVDCKDGFSGGASEENLTNQSRFGFFRNYSKDASVPFEVGNLSVTN
jgi:hypothetical protein